MADVSTESPPTLDDQLCFDLYAASRAVTSLYRPLLGELGITYPQYLVLLVLWTEGRQHVRDLGAALHLDHGTLTPLVRRMEAAGLVTRERASGDERFVEVGLTAKGESLGRHAHGIQCQVKGVLGLDDEEFRALQTTLRVVTSRAMDPAAAQA
jgi:DNA-binding MarR family transcriptional regulator